MIHCKRPFASVEEMDEAMIERWNAVVKSNDDVWHLGDFNFRSDHDTRYYLERLRGRIHFVLGNHDDKDAKKYHTDRLNGRIPSVQGSPGFASVQEVKYLRLYGEQITLYHYAQRVWRNSHHGAWHLYGHSHGSLPHYHRSMDVGVDVHDFRPISFEEVRAYMVDQDVTLHHPEMQSDPWDRTL
jgi:calcineurin-like phosphoesterase family protein